MSKRKIITLSLISAFVIAAAFGAVAYTSARAAQLTSSTSTGLFNIQDHRGPVDVTDEALAEALGITVDELNAARDEARAAVLEQAVTDGLITQAQADAITERANGRGIGPFLGLRLGNFLSKNGVEYDTYLAEALGISVDDLEAARLQAFTDSLNQAVADGDITQEQADLILGRRLLFADSTFQSGMQSAFEAAVNQAVSSGVITQAQADQILANSSGMWSPGMGGGHRPGGHRGGDFGPPTDPTIMP